MISWQSNALGVMVGAVCLVSGCGSQLATEPDPVPGVSPVAAIPAPPPPPILLKEGAFGVYTAGSTTFTSFSTDVSGRVQLNLDWEPTGQETTLSVRVKQRSFEGACAPGCEREDLCPSSCRTEMESWVDLAAHPVTLETTAALEPENYELHVSYYDPLDYLLPWHPDMDPRVRVSYQILLHPAASGASLR